jgi:acyl-coenzyme A synthetase/AMP-(fatty) acid ligase
VALVDEALDPDALDEIVRRYEPRFVLTPDGVAQELDVPDGPEPHPDLALLLSTSGTTGSPKQHLRPALG